MPLTKTELAYIAGIVDGEGSIMLMRCNARASGAYVFPQVKIANTSRVLIEWLQQKVGAGTINYRSRMNPRCKDVFHWGLSSNQAIEFIKAIRPYLIIKGQQADVALAIWEENEAAVTLTGKRIFGHGNPVPMWLRHFRNACFFYMKDLNRRGSAGSQCGEQVRNLIDALATEEAALCH